MDGWMDEWMGGWMDGRMDGRMDEERRSMPTHKILSSASGIDDGSQTFHYSPIVSWLRRAVTHELSVLSDYNKTFTEHRQKALPGHFVGESGKNVPILGYEGLVKNATDVIENVLFPPDFVPIKVLASQWSTMHHF
jgi:hypothetical protein